MSVINHFGLMLACLAVFTYFSFRRMKHRMDRSEDRIDALFRELAEMTMMMMKRVACICHAQQLCFLYPGLISSRKLTTWVYLEKQ